MLRRVHVPSVYLGEIPLDAAQARHVRDVLRLASGARVEAFDDAGNVATGELILRARGEACVKVEAITTRADGDAAVGFDWTIAAAVPKGERADWMVEKLSELGAAAFIPLAAARSVVLPEGRNKRDRWVRIATESAKQSRRVGVMRIGELTSVETVLQQIKSPAEAETTTAAGWYLSTTPDAKPIAELVPGLPAAGRSLVALIGPEGGWSDDERGRFTAAGVLPVRLTSTVLRVETAAIATAAIIAAHAAGPRVSLDVTAGAGRPSPA